MEHRATPDYGEVKCVTIVGDNARRRVRLAGWVSGRFRCDGRLDGAEQPVDFGQQDMLVAVRIFGIGIGIEREEVAYPPARLARPGYEDRGHLDTCDGPAGVAGTVTGVEQQLRFGVGGDFKVDDEDGFW